MTKTMANRRILAVLAGGAGTRFWPRSRKAIPKQFLPLSQPDMPLLVETFERFSSGTKNTFDDQWVITSKALESISRTTLDSKPSLRSVRLFLEPEPRNTAPAIFWPVYELCKTDPDAVVAFLPCDQAIVNVKRLNNQMDAAVSWAEKHDDIVLLGIRPTRPETGFGYLELDDKPLHTSNSESGENQVFKLTKFIEKPTLERAQSFLKSPHFCWNGGMFVARAKVFLSAFKSALPAYFDVIEKHHGNFDKAYPHLEATSIDFGVMEKAKNIVAIPMDCGWDDLGSWTALETLAESRHELSDVGVIRAKDQFCLESKGLIVDTPKHIIATLGVEDLVIVESDGVILVMKKDRAQDIRKVVDAVKNRRPELL